MNEIQIGDVQEGARTGPGARDELHHHHDGASWLVYANLENLTKTDVQS